VNWQRSLPTSIQGKSWTDSYLENFAHAAPASNAISLEENGAEK